MQKHPKEQGVKEARKRESRTHALDTETFQEKLQERQVARIKKDRGNAIKEKRVNNSNQLQQEAIQKSLLVELDIEELSIEDRCVGSLLTAMIGDILGAATEGKRGSRIRNNFPKGVRDFESCYHMGVAHLGKRKGMYTDDTNALLALATSLVEKSGLDPAHASRQYAEFWTSEPTRGAPQSAGTIMKEILNGTDYRKTGTIVFKDGSYANGGAMRIAPLALAFRNATEAELYEAVCEAIICSHVHPAARDGAFLLALSIQLVLTQKSATFSAPEFLESILKACHTKDMRKNITALIKHFHEISSDTTKETQQEIDAAFAREIGADDFQIESWVAIPLVLWCFVRHYKNPEAVLIECINFGGDTDTVASMAGAIAGALHGTCWIPRRWFDNIENNERGRDYIIDCGQKIASLDCKEKL